MLGEERISELLRRGEGLVLAAEDPVGVVADVDLSLALDRHAPGVGARAGVVDAGDAIHRPAGGFLAGHCWSFGAPDALSFFVDRADDYDVGILPMSSLRGRAPRGREPVRCSRGPSGGCIRLRRGTGGRE